MFMSGLARALGVSSEEADSEDLSQVLRSFGFLFLLMAAYYILQPLRDEIGLRLGSAAAPTLFRWSLVAMVAANPLLALALARLPRPRLVPLVIRFFAFHLVIFWVAFRAAGESSPVGFYPLLPAVYYLWVGVFNLFCVSLFWSMMADLFNAAKARRYFGLIGAGASLGQMAGSALAGLTVNWLGPTTLLAVAAAILELGLWIRPHHDPPHGDRLGPKPATPVWGGISAVAKSPYLMGICGFLFLYTFTSSFLYFQKQEWVERTLTSRAARVQFFSGLNLIGSLSTLLVQFFLTGRLLSTLGLGACLALVPLLSMAGFAWLALSGSLMTLAWFEVIRKTANYGVARPSREILFTAVPTQQKYLSKNFIDTFVYRAGDALASVAFDALKLGLHLSSGVISSLAVPCSLIWLLIGLALGRAFLRKTQAHQEE